MAHGKFYIRTLRAAVLASASLLAVSAAHADKLKLTVLPPAAPAQGGAVQALQPLNPYYGNISGFYGNISGFWGNISGFYGNISGFYGNISGFGGTTTTATSSTTPYATVSTIQAQVDPFWGDITAFKTGLGANVGLSNVNYAGIQPFWAGVASQWQTTGQTWGNLGAYSSANSAAYSTVASQLQTIVNQSQAFWGSSVQLRTGQSFNDAITTPILAKFGIDLTNPASLAALSPSQQSLFIMSWYDNLMEYTGTDHVDHWMSEVNWSPALTQVQGSGSNTVIGLLDFTIKNAPDLQDNVISSGGVSTFSNGHGAAVASLMVAAHDGTGVMGIAPRASVVQYNPFDATGTASWTDITNGMIALAKGNASVINASLGVPGYTLSPGWNAVLTNSALRNAANNTILVTAAGNEGVSQTANIEWDKNNMPILVVGSVSPNLTISSFSNTPGTACFTQKGKCSGDYLMNHFLVASGEMMLVSDDNGSFTRMSGTSFAAPLVSGAIALLQDRWPWLTQHPTDTAYVLLHTAKDLGAPGPDPVYGMGLLDVTASQSPISYNSLQWFSAVKGSLVPVPTAAATLHDPNLQATWQASSAYVYAYEQLPESFRDFAIPLSSKLLGQTVMGATGQQEYLQYYLTGSFMTWAGASAPTSSNGKGKSKAMLDFRPQSEGPSMGTVLGMNLSMSAEPREVEPGWRSSAMGLTTHVSLTTDDRMSGVKFGFGNGGSALSGATGMGLQSDYDPMRGGANPLLGFASGGAYGAVSFGIAPHVQVSAGFTGRSAQRDLNDLVGSNHLAAYQVGDYRAGATRVGVSWRVSDGLQLSSGWTRLSEANAFLGMQSTDPNDIRKGASTNGMDFGADMALGRGFMVSATGAMMRTQQSGTGTQNLAIVGDGLKASSFEIALGKVGVLDKSDHLRFSLSQPLYVEGGQMSYTGIEVIDRDTGELGSVTRTFEARQAARPLAAQLLYGRTAFNGAAQVGVFGRMETNGVDAQGHSAAVFMTGAGMRLPF